MRVNYSIRKIFFNEDPLIGVFKSHVVKKANCLAFFNKFLNMKMQNNCESIFQLETFN